MCVVGSGQGVLGRVRVEEFLAPSTTMLRILQMNIAGTPQNEVAQIMQHTGVGGLPKTRLAATRTGTMCEVTTAANDLRLRQIGGVNDPFGGIGQVPSGTRHDNALHGQVSLAWNLRHLVIPVMVSYQ